MAEGIETIDAAEEFSEQGNVLVLSVSTSLNVDDIVKGILRINVLPYRLQTKFPGGKICRYNWRADNKYYTAEVSLWSSYAKKCNDIDTKLLADDLTELDGIIIGFDISDDANLDPVKSWLGFVKDTDPEIRILLSSEKLPTSEDQLEAKRAETLQWCLENSFELIELRRTEEEDDDDEDEIIPERFGFDRVVEALQVHVWPNLVRKDTVQDNQISNIAPEGTKVEKLSDDEAKCKDYLDMKIKKESDNAGKSVVDAGFEEESFEELFDKFRIMKETAQSLPSEERKQYAEKVAIAFWRALGGEEDEIADL